MLCSKILADIDSFCEPVGKSHHERRLFWGIRSYIIVSQFQLIFFIFMSDDTVCLLCTEFVIYTFFSATGVCDFQLLYCFAVPRFHSILAYNNNKGDTCGILIDCRVVRPR